MGDLMIQFEDSRDQPCDCGQHDVRHIYGSVYEDGVGLGVYLAGIPLMAAAAEHQCSDVMFGVALMDFAADRDNPADEAPDGDITRTRKYQRCVQSASIRVSCDDDHFVFGFTDKVESPFASFTVLGTMLERDAALASELRPAFLRVAEHIAVHDPAVNSFLNGDPDS